MPASPTAKHATVGPEPAFDREAQSRRAAATSRMVPAAPRGTPTRDAQVRNDSPVSSLRGVINSAVLADVPKVTQSKVERTFGIHAKHAVVVLFPDIEDRADCLVDAGIRHEDVDAAEVG